MTLIWIVSSAPCPLTCGFRSRSSPSLIANSGAAPGLYADAGLSCAALGGDAYRCLGAPVHSRVLRTGERAKACASVEKCVC